MSIPALAQSAFLLALSEVGESVTYTPGVGEASSIDVVVERESVVMDFAMGETEARRWTVRVLASDVATPANGDVVTIGGEEFVVEKKPTTKWGIHTVSVIDEEKLDVSERRLRRKF